MAMIPTKVKHGFGEVVKLGIAIGIAVAIFVPAIGWLISWGKSKLPQKPAA